MTREIVEPVETPEEFSPGDKSFSIRHPSYAQIGASRVSGECVLYGSDFVHRSSIRLRISHSMLRRNLSTDWPHADRPFVEVEMSEAQWATFVSSLNIGDGVQCTLRYRDGLPIAGIPEPVDRREQFSRELAGQMAGAMDEIKALREELGAAKISAKARGDILGRLSAIERDIGGNTKFVAERFDRHMENTVERAKTEVNAYATSTIMRMGLDAIAEGAPLRLGKDEVPP